MNYVDKLETCIIILVVFLYAVSEIQELKTRIKKLEQKQPQYLSQHPIPKDTSELNDLKVNDEA